MLDWSLTKKSKFVYCIFFVASVGMQPDLILNEDQRKERFSLSLGRKKIKTEHLALSTSNPTATASSLLNSTIPRTTIYRIVSEGSQTTEKSSKQEYDHRTSTGKEL